MTTGLIKRLLDKLCAGRLEPHAASDGRLLEAFVARREEEAFATLVGLHGPMVFGVCRRVLGDVHDADDAYQATFLVLARKAATLSRPDQLGNWLYGVAYRTSLEARAVRARRRAREVHMDKLPDHAAPTEESDGDLAALIDRELNRLPDKYRVPAVLCELQGRSRREVAELLGIPEGTLSYRLAEARKRLARRLARWSAALGAGGLATCLPQTGVAIVPAPLTALLVKAAVEIAAGRAATSVSAEVVALMEGVLRVMFITRLKTLVAVMMALGLLVGTAGWFGLQPLSQSPTPPGSLKEIDEKDQKKAGEMKPFDALQGAWRFAKVDVEQEGLSGEVKEQLEDWGKVVVKGDKVTLILDIAELGEEKKEVWLADFTILKSDQSKTPQTIDLRLDKRTPIWSPKEDPDAIKPKDPMQAIFSLEGDALKLYFGKDEKVPPEAFPKKEKQGIITLTRTKQQKGREDKPAQGKTINPSKNLITGIVLAEEEVKLGPPNGFISKKEDFDKLWKVWQLGDKVPVVDFKTHLVVVVTSKEGPIKSAALFNEKNTGAMKIKVELDRKINNDGKAIAVHIAVFPRAGVTSIEGRAIADK
jgi:RNA polymerase sigma factor (sigma-70 family)